MMTEYVIDVPDNIECVKWSEVDAKTRLMGLPLREEIIRCRDCKGREGDEFSSPCPSYLLSGEDPDGFCAWADRDA